MKISNKYLYVFLEDALTNPHLQFDLHLKPRPDTRASYAKTAFESLEKQQALNAFERVQDAGFWCLSRLLNKRRILEGKLRGMIVSANFDEPSIIIDEWIHKDYKGGEFHTFIPLPPFPEDLDLDDISIDPLLNMRVGRIILNALLD